MKKIFNKSHLTLAIIALSLTGCSAFDTRMQPLDDYDYLDGTLVDKYQTGRFSNEESRNSYALPSLTPAQEDNGYVAPNIDIRPPTQLISVIDGVFLDPAETSKSKVLFNALDTSDDMSRKIWDLLDAYLAENNVNFVFKDASLLQLETDVFTQKTSHGASFSKNVVVKESSYRFNVEQTSGRYGASFSVDALSYSENNDGELLPFNLSEKTKRNVELGFINDFLLYVYQQRVLQDEINAESVPLPIRLGFDENNQTAWIVDAKFSDTWIRLPRLTSLLGFETIETDQNLGYMLLQFSEPKKSYWSENNLNEFTLEEAEYFIQLGELNDGSTSILWLDKDKKPLESNKVSEIYLSITDKVRDVLLLKDNQSKPL